MFAPATLGQKTQLCARQNSLLPGPNRSMQSSAHSASLNPAARRPDGPALFAAIPQQGIMVPPAQPPLCVASRALLGLERGLESWADRLAR